LRFVTALAGILVSVPPVIFFWIGTQTFIRPLERVLALVVTIEAGALLLLSVTLIFTPSVQRAQIFLLLATGTTVIAIVVADRLLR
jgi:hypothetical protein